MDKAFEKVVQMLEETGELDETLLIVTSDHGHTMTISGYPFRGNSIVGNNSMQRHYTPIAL